MKVMLNISEVDYNSFMYGSNATTTNSIMSRFIESMDNATIIIPDNATNGDVLKTLFPYHSLIFNYDEDYILFIIENSMCCKFTLNWWNAPYKEKNNNANAN